ncbi:unnamed protein product [Brassica napus]|uniref:(rape) hypothetical protein n=1 Tax=Brassica napus TaxID=3708 RepID=A0A816KSU8_BRANA|nr:unnamed protein product [Brassica napus]
MTTVFVFVEFVLPSIIRASPTTCLHLKTDLGTRLMGILTYKTSSNPNGSLFAYKNPLFCSCFIGCISVPLIRSASHDFSIVGYSPEDLEAHDKHIELFENWLSNFEKAYETVEEKLRRFEVFKDNLKHIDETNKKVKSYWLGLNEFADLSHKEFKNKERERERKKRKGESSPELVAGATVCRDHVELVTTVRCSLESPETAMQPSSCSSRQDEAVDTNHASIGARTKPHAPPEDSPRRARETHAPPPSAATPPPDHRPPPQLRRRNTVLRRSSAVAAGQLSGSCWAFSTVAAMEGINKIVTGNLKTLSEQELIDCGTTFNGGLMDYAFEYIVKNGGLRKEENYPYSMEEGTCETQKDDSEMVNISGHQNVPRNDDKSLLKALAHQPLSIAIDASGREFQFYKGGVFDGRCGVDLDRAG